MALPLAGSGAPGVVRHLGCHDVGRACCDSESRGPPDDPATMTVRRGSGHGPALKSRAIGPRDSWFRVLGATKRMLGASGFTGSLDKPDDHVLGWARGDWAKAQEADRWRWSVGAATAPAHKALIFVDPKNSFACHKFCHLFLFICQSLVREKSRQIFFISCLQMRE